MVLTPKQAYARHLKLHSQSGCKRNQVPIRVVSPLRPLELVRTIKRGVLWGFFSLALGAATGNSPWTYLI